MTSTERRRTWSERLDPRNWSLVAKLAVVGLVPTVLALAIGAVRVVDQANVAEQLGQGSGLVEAHQQVGALTQALQAERAAAVTFVGGNRLGDRNAVDSAQAATDQAVNRANTTLATAEQQAPQLATAKRQADTTLGQLQIIRSQVATAPTPAADVTTRYTSVVQRTLALDRALLGQLQTSDTAGLATALGSTAAATEALELERTVLGGAIAASQLQEAQKALVNGAEASYQAAASDYQAALTPQQVDQFGNFATDPANAARQGLRDTIMATSNDGRVTADAAAWNAAVDSSVGVVRSADRQAEEQFVGGRAQAAEEAGNTAGLNSVLLMLGLLLTVGIILLLGRQLVRSLRVLRTSALDVAERRLPQAVQGMRAGQAPSALVEPVPLDSRDEIGEVARAFDAVHGQAIRLAADQAALQQNVNSMFVNLSRRSQALVERQLQLIEQLESNEQDPDQLSNLFQLDHLATRMRRNSENLLVLAGTDLAKRNVAPVQVVDVLRAAVSEVEQYQRVVVQTPPNATIAGRAANDLVHLLAELLDNATNFSPPDSQVVMSTTRTADESLLIEIADRGVGMGDSELSDANQRLSGPSEVDVSASRRMGLFVVGRLAARHRIGVRLSSASGAGRSGGLSASVTVPAQLVPSAAPVVEQPREAVGTGEWGAVAGGDRPVPAERQPVPVNGSAPGASSVAGADGPVPPTFGSGGGSGPARNGSAPKLPTRTPGSALRRNAGDQPGPGSTGGQEAAPNGSSVRGISAFAPSPEGGEGNGGADVFTPAADGPPSGAYRTPAPNDGMPQREERRPIGGRPGPEDRNGPADGPYRPGDAPEPADTAEPTDTVDAAPTAAASAPTAPDEVDEGADRTPGDAAAESGTNGTDGTTGGGGTGRGLLGAAGAAGVGGVFAGVFGRRNEPDDGPTTEQIDRVEDGESPAPEQQADDAAPTGTEVDAPAEHSVDEDVDEGTLVDAEHPDHPEAPADAVAPVGTAFGETGSVETADRAEAADRDDAEPQAPATTGSGDLPLRTLDVRVRPAAPQPSQPPRDEAPTAEETADTADPTDTGDTDETGDGGRTAAGWGAAAAGAAAGGAVAFASGAGDRREESQTVETSGAEAEAAERAPEQADDRTPQPVAEQPVQEPGDSETDTTAFPDVRPPREPMGGTRPPMGRTGPPQPAPARRPVMPGAQSSGPSSTPSSGPPSPGPQAPQRPTPGTPATGPAGPARTGPGPSGPGPSGPAGPGSRPPEGQRPLPRVSARNEQDALFAPAVPVEGDRGQLRRPGGLESARAGGGYDISQTTPIFEEIASAWFRSNRSVPVRWQDGGPAPAGQGEAAEQAPSALGQRPSPAPRPGAGPAPTAGPGAPSGAPAQGGIDDTGFASPADDVWRQAAAGADETEQSTEEVTQAGLPKRRPRARLLPGSAAGSTVLSPPTASESRSAENVRGRLASYQQGVRQGRESRTTQTGNDAPEQSTGDRSHTSDNEEQT